MALPYPVALRRAAPRSLAHILFLAFAAYLAVPLYDVPLWGISLSAPVLLFVFAEMLTGTLRVSFGGCDKWMLLAAFFWLGCAASLVGNQLFGSQRPIVASEAYMLVRWGYWMTAFAVTLVLCSNAGFRSKVCMTLGLAVLGLAGLRIAEAVLFGRWGHGDSRLLSPNAYGWEFSTFAPYALAMPAMLKGDRRRVSVAGAALLVVAAIANGSRGSWVALSAGMVVFIGLCSFNWRAFRQYSTGLAVTLLLAGGAMWFGRGAWLAPVAERARSFEQLEYDKSYTTRRLLVQKGLKLFGENPLFGAGASRFKAATAVLERPLALRYSTQEALNRKSSHNSYIGVLAEMGLAGSVPLAILLASLAVKGLRAAVRAVRQGDIWPVAVYVSFVSMSMHLWVLSGLTGTAPWFIYGLTAASITRTEARHRVGARRVTAFGLHHRRQLRPA